MSAPAGPFQLPPLPWAENALDPVISSRTIGLHYGKHHRTYVNKLNELVAGTPLADMPLERVIQESAGGGGKPSGEVAQRIDSDLGGYDRFRQQFADAAVNCFGSGWAWLVDRGGKLEIVATSNAGTPITQGATPLLTIDVWEHAYYVDYENRRPDFVNAVIDKLLNWEHAQKQLASAKGRKAA